MKSQNKPEIKRNSPQSSADDFTPEQIAEWKAGVARRREELFSKNDWKYPLPATAWVFRANRKNAAHHRLEKEK